jgi:hypothetical protein
MSFRIHMMTYRSLMRFTSAVGKAINQEVEFAWFNPSPVGRDRQASGRNQFRAGRSPGQLQRSRMVRSPKNKRRLDTAGIVAPSPEPRVLRRRPRAYTRLSLAAVEIKESRHVSLSPDAGKSANRPALVDRQNQAVQNRR